MFLVVYVLYLLYVTVQGDPTVCVNVTREGWNGQQPRMIDYIVFPVDYVVIQHTAGPACTTVSACSNIVNGIQNYHMTDVLNFGDIGYSFLVGGDGNVYEGRGWHKVGAHTYGYNTKSIGIALIGNFEVNTPTTLQLQATKDFLMCGVTEGELSEDFKLYGARQLGQTLSPGIKLYNKIQKWSHFSTNIPAPKAG